MNNVAAMSISIGVLGGIDTLMTATIVPVPVWVTFIAWASFFALGGGVDGLVRSIASNITGIVIASLTLLSIGIVGTDPVIAAICVGLGSAAMVQASRVPLLSITPGVVFGFASTVGTTAAIGNPIDTVGLGNPALVAAAAMIIGGLYGYASELFGNMLTKESQVA